MARTYMYTVLCACVYIIAFVYMYAHVTCVFVCVRVRAYVCASVHVVCVRMCARVTCECVYLFMHKL